MTTQQTLFAEPVTVAGAMQPAELVECDRCGFDRFLDVPIHGGRSRRRDCARCGRTLGFPVWYGRDTRAAAAAAIEPMRASMLNQVAAFVADRGDDGATDFEIRTALKMLGDTARARRHELVKAGVVVATDRTRPSPAGCPMTVWTSTGKPLD